MSIGPLELVVVALVVLALFGPALIAFWLGYLTGRRSVAPPPADVPPAPPTPDEEIPADE